MAKGVTKMAFTLREVIEEYYDELESEKRLKSFERTDDEEDDTTRKTNFYQDKVKNFNEIVYVVDLEDEMKQLKMLSSNNYSFTFEGRKFVLQLLREYTGKFEPIRRGEIYKADGGFVLEVYRGFLNLFRDAKADSELLDCVANKLYNRLDVPIRMEQATRKAASLRVEEMIKKNMGGCTLGMGALERYEWLIGLRQDLEAVIQKWDDLYSIMGELRQDELNRQAEVYAEKMTADEIYEAELDFAYSREYLEAERNDTEYMELLEKWCKITGRPFEAELLRFEDYKTIKKNHKIFKAKKKPFVKKIEKEFEEVRIKLAERAMELRTQVIKKHIPDYVPADIEESEVDFSGLCSTEELLEKAIEGLKEDWKMEIKRKERREVELPEKSMEEIYKELDDLVPVGIRKNFYPNRKEGE